MDKSTVQGSAATPSADAEAIAEGLWAIAAAIAELAGAVRQQDGLGADDGEEEIGFYMDGTPKKSLK